MEIKFTGIVWCYLRDYNFSRNVESGCQTHELSEMKDSIRNCSKAHSFYILWNNLAVFHPENLRETEFKTNRLIGLAEELSRQDNIQVMLWLLITACIHLFRKNDWKNTKKSMSLCGRIWKFKVADKASTKKSSFNS